MPDDKQLRFPNRKERKKLVDDLKNLGQDPNVASNEYYKRYTESIEKLDKKMDELSAVDESGIPKDLTAEDAASLSQAMIDTAKIAEMFIASSVAAGMKPDQGAPGVVNNLQGMLSRDFETIQNYDPSTPKSLPELLEDSRTRTIDLRGRQLGSVTNMQNSRIPMTVVNSKGEKRKGVFTKANYFNAEKEYKDLIEKAKSQCTRDSDKAKLDAFLGVFKKKNLGIRLPDNGRLSADSPDSMVIGTLVRKLYAQHGSEKLERDDIRLEFARAGIDPSTLPRKALNVLTEGLTKFKDSIGMKMNTINLKLDEGSRLDNRNTTMSSVATLLGTPDLIAHSENMKFIGEDGKVTEGTFMDHAKGVDLYKKPHLFKHVNTSPFGLDDNKGRVLKQIADLQVLDYICMNKDRHPGNIFYEVDKDGVITGIQGIDNDSSFGTGRYSEDALDDLRVVSKSMAEKVKSITPSMLKFALRGRGLSEKEIEAAKDRLLDLQEGIEAQRVKVVDDDSFGRLHIKSLYPMGMTSSNMFSLTNEYVNRKVQQYADPGKPFEPMPDQGEPQLREVSTTDRKGTVGGLLDSLGQVSRKVTNEETGFNVDSLTTRMRGSSPQFKAMVSAAKDAMRLFGELSADGQIDPSKIATDPEAMKTLQKVIGKFEDLDKATDEYLEFKIKDRSASGLGDLTGRNKYEQKHIDYAKDLKKISDMFKQSFARPSTREEQEDKEANIQRQELAKKRSEAGKENEGPVLR